MSDRNCPDERMAEWLEKKRQNGYYVLTTEEMRERGEDFMREAYAEGRKDEREELLKAIRAVGFDLREASDGSIFLLNVHAEAAIACEIRCEG